MLIAQKLLLFHITSAWNDEVMIFLLQIAFFVEHKWYLSDVSGLRPATLLKQTTTQVFSIEIYKILKNTEFEEHLRTTATVISKSWMLSFIQICVCQKSIRTIASKENFPSVSFRVRVRVRIGVSFGDRDNFPRRQLS